MGTEATAATAVMFQGRVEDPTQVADAPGVPTHQAPPAEGELARILR